MPIPSAVLPSPLELALTPAASELSPVACVPDPYEEAFVPLATAWRPVAVELSPLALAPAPVATDKTPPAFALLPRAMPEVAVLLTIAPEPIATAPPAARACDWLPRATPKAPDATVVGPMASELVPEAAAVLAEGNGARARSLALAADRGGVDLGGQYVRADGDGALLKGAKSRNSSVTKVDGVDRSRVRSEANGYGVLVACGSAITLGNRIQSGRGCPEPERGSAQPGRPGNIADRRRLRSVGARIQAKGGRACGCDRVDTNGACSVRGGLCVPAYGERVDTGRAREDALCLWN